MAFIAANYGTVLELNNGGAWGLLTQIARYLPNKRNWTQKPHQVSVSVSWRKQ